ncbi:MAG TPA: hypothetical protein VGN37_13135 [Actinocatenispora sp.]
MNHDEQYRREDERDVRGAVGQIAAELAAEGLGLPARLSILHGPNDHLVESRLAVEVGSGDEVAATLAGLSMLAASPAGRSAIDLLVADLVPSPMRAWLLVFESTTSVDVPVPERVTIAVDRSGRGYAALSSGRGSTPAVCMSEFTGGEAGADWTPLYQCLALLALDLPTGSAT